MHFSMSLLHSRSKTSSKKSAELKAGLTALGLLFCFNVRDNSQAKDLRLSRKKSAGLSAGLKAFDFIMFIL